MIRRTPLFLVLFLLSLNAAATPQADVRKIFERHHSPDQPGAVMLAVRDGEVLPSSAITFFHPDSFLTVELARIDGEDVLVLRNRGTEIDCAAKVVSSSND